MSQLYEELKKEASRLEKIIHETTDNIERAPEGKLKIAYSGKIPRYYHKSSNEYACPPQGKYLKKENIGLAYELAQRDYDEKIRKIALERLKGVNKLMELYQEDRFKQVYDHMHPERQKIVSARIITDEEYLNYWKSKAYKGRFFAENTPEINTNKGERVRSKSEKIIADMLEKRNIPYRYEAPLILHGFGTVYPDFTVLNVKKRQELYWEHFGLMENSEYCEKALRKIGMYLRNDLFLGDRLIISYETTKSPLETQLIERNIRKYLL